MLTSVRSLSNIPIARIIPAERPRTRLVWNNAMNPGPTDIVRVRPKMIPGKNAFIVKQITGKTTELIHPGVQHYSEMDGFNNYLK